MGKKYFIVVCLLLIGCQMTLTRLSKHFARAPDDWVEPVVPILERCSSANKTELASLLMSDCHMKCCDKETGLRCLFGKCQNPNATTGPNKRPCFDVSEHLLPKAEYDCNPSNVHDCCGDRTGLSCISVRSGWEIKGKCIKEDPNFHLGIKCSAATYDQLQSLRYKRCSSSDYTDQKGECCGHLSGYKCIEKRCQKHEDYSQSSRFHDGRQCKDLPDFENTYKNQVCNPSYPGACCPYWAGLVCKKTANARFETCVPNTYSSLIKKECGAATDLELSGLKGKPCNNNHECCNSRTNLTCSGRTSWMKVCS